MESSTTNAAGRASIGRWIARILAVLAVAGAAIALFLVISGSMESDEKGSGKKAATEQKQEQEKPDESKETPDSYVVQPGDSLGSIAVKVGVSVERIEELNPQIDPQAVPSGATLKLK